MSAGDYKAIWDERAATALGAMLAVDGSADESVLRATGAYTASQVRAALELERGDRVLELGCGVARIGRELAGEVAFWHGVDISANMVQHARARLLGFDNVFLDVLDGARLPMLADASFDKAYAVAVFIHVDKEDFVLLLHELWRVLKPGGRLYFDTWNLAHPIGYRRFEYELARRAHEPRARTDGARNQFCTPQEVSIYLERAGFERLLLIDDSPQLQAVAQRPGCEDARSAAHRVALHQEQIEYGARWARLFERHLGITYAGEHPRAMYAELDANAQDEQTRVYRMWLRSLWRQNEARWGPAPPD